MASNNSRRQNPHSVSLRHIALSNHSKMEGSQVAQKKKPESSKAKKARIELFGPPALLYGETEDTFYDLLERVSEVLKPIDIFDEFSAWDITNAMVDSMRFARLKPELLNANMHKGLERVLEPLCDMSVQLRMDRLPLDADKIAAGWAAGEPSSLTAVDERLDGASLSMDAVVAETLSYEMEGFEGIDRQAMNSEARRYAALREFERRREAKRNAVPVARMSRLAKIENAKANDNEKSSSEIVVEVDAGETVPAADAIKRDPKAVGE